MSAKTDYLENKMIDWFFRGQAFTPPVTFYVGLFTSSPSDSAGGTEVSTSTTGYSRPSIAASLANFAGTQGAGSTVASSGTSGTTSNNVDIVFPQATANWGTVVAFGLFDAPSGGNLLWWGSLTVSRPVYSGDIPKILAGSLSLQEDN